LMSLFDCLDIGSSQSAVSSWIWSRLLQRYYQQRPDLPHWTDWFFFRDVVVGGYERKRGCDFIA
jgi:hypothetical protein